MCVCVYIYLYMYICIYINIYYIYIYVYICIYLNICIYINICVYSYINIYVYIYTSSIYPQHCSANINMKHYRSPSNFGLVSPLISFQRQKQLPVAITNHKPHTLPHPDVFIIFTPSLGVHMPNVSLICS